MNMHLNRWTFGAMKRRTKLTDFRFTFDRGPYGSSSSYLTLFGKTFTHVRRYPDDRLRCVKCGSRSNDRDQR